MNIEKMKRFMDEHNLTPKDMAKAANINESTWFRKVNRNEED